MSIGGYVMATIIPFIKTDWRGVFEPQTIDAMSQAFDELCEQLAIPPTAEAAREVVAQRVIGLARKASSIRAPAQKLSRRWLGQLSRQHESSRKRHGSFCARTTSSRGKNT